MRILYVVQHFGGPSGSGSGRAFEHARRLVAWGHEVTLLCGLHDRSGDADVREAREHGIEVLQAPIAYSQRLSYVRRLLVFRRYMRWAERMGRAAPRPDVVLASSTPLTVGEIGRRIAAHHRVPLVFEVRDLWPEVPIAVGALRTPVLRAMGRNMARRVYGAAAEVVALSPGMASVIQGSWGVPADRITVIPNASDVALFGGEAPVRGREALRARLGWSGRFVAIHPGAMGVVNGLDYLLDAAALLDRSGEDRIRIVLLGDGAERPRLEARIRQERLRSIAVHPPVPKRDIPGWLAAADAGVAVFVDRPFLDTNSANKFFDFLAAGLPVLINYGGWMASLLQESGAGFATDPAAPATMVDRLRELSADPGRCAAMGRAARRLAEERFARDDLARALEEVLARAARSAALARQ